MNGLRHELKFTLHKDAATVLKQRLSLLLPFDNNANPNGEYYVTSLYFDTIDADAYFEKMDGVQTRRKYRIRFYNQNLDFIRLECKEKFDSMTQKRQARISLPYAQKIIANQIEALDVEGEQVLQEFLIDLKTKHLMPSVIVDYRRTAFVHESLDVRITFDEHIHSRRFDTDLFEPTFSGIKVHEDAESVIEIKFDEILPYSVWAILNSVPLSRQAISKFALCRGMQ